MIANNAIRLSAKANGVMLWQIADKLGVSEATMTRMLRKELPDDRKEKLLEVIKELSMEGGDNNEYEHNTDFPAENENGTAVDGPTEAG